MTDVCHTHIICFGNPLHGDDGFGTAVFSALQDRSLPLHAKVIDGGTSSLSALNLFDQCDYAIVVDALHCEEKTGVLSWFKPETFAQHSSQGEMSSHGLGVNSILMGLDILKQDGEKIPELDILTCRVSIPKTFNMELSPNVENAIENAVDLILKKLNGGKR